VAGWANASTGATAGLCGHNYSSSGMGVRGIEHATGGTNYGVYGESASTSGRGLYGRATNTTGIAFGAYGQSDSTSGIGVYGYASASSGDTYGVYGVANPTGTGSVTAGAYGRSLSDDGFGVAGHNYWGGVGVGAWSFGGNLIEAYAGDYPYGTLRFYVDSSGTVHAVGYQYVAQSLDQAGNQYHTLSGMASPEAWYEDFGSATLAGGQAAVTLEPVFASLVNLETGYHVYVTPLCDEAVVLFVSEKSAKGFTVEGVTLDSKPSQCAFDYRIVAKPLGSEEVRLEVVTLPETVEVEREAEPLPPELPEQPQLPKLEPGQRQPVDGVGLEVGGSDE
jgi:hypothetical protein